MPFHVPATDLTSDTMTGVTGPRLAQQANEDANPTRTVAVRTLQSDRGPLVFIAPPLFRAHIPGDNWARDAGPAWVEETVPRQLLDDTELDALGCQLQTCTLRRPLHRV